MVVKRFTKKNRARKIKKSSKTKMQIGGGGQGIDLKALAKQLQARVNSHAGNPTKQMAAYTQAEQTLRQARAYQSLHSAVHAPPPKGKVKAARAAKAAILAGKPY